MSNRAVSIILPTYNRATLLGRAIDSVIGQTYPHWELIVVDDGSTDETDTLLSAYAASLGRRLVVIRQTHGGASAARNAGIDRATGRYVAFLDSDDVFVPQKLARQVSLFERRPELGLVFSDMSMHALDGTPHPSTFDRYAPMVRRIPTEELGDGQFICGPDAVDHLVRRYCIPTITGMVRRDVLGTDVRFLTDQTYSEEWLFFLEVAARSRCGYIDEPLSVQYCQRDSASTRCPASNARQQYEALTHIRRRFPNVSREAGRCLRDQMVTCCRQMGFDAFKARRFQPALRHFQRGWFHRPDFRGLVWIAQAVWQMLRSRLPHTPPQEAAAP
ncbi:MAG: glycosyltransferase [Phycisphaerae bacterium]|nr:glycosyltransferase [Phycisphaerae bacterium]